MTFNVTDYQSANHQLCAHCKKVAHLTCAGCKASPSYPGTKPTAHCNRLKTRITLHRAAVLLEAIMLRIRKHAYPMEFTSLRFEPPLVYLEGFETLRPDYLRQLKLFAAPAGAVDKKLLEAAMMYISDGEALEYLYCFIKVFFQGMSSKIEEIQIKSSQSSSVVLPAVPLENLSELRTSFRTLLRIIVKNGEVWAIDASGRPASGNPDPLCAWDEVERMRVGKVLHENALGTARDRTNTAEGMFGGMSAVARLLEKNELVVALEEMIPAWSQKRGGNLSAVLRGSEEQYQVANKDLLVEIERHVELSLGKMYTVEEVVRRRKKVIACSARFSADPSRPARFEDVLDEIEAAGKV